TSTWGPAFHLRQGYGGPAIARSATAGSRPTSDSRVPRITVSGRRRSAAVADILQTVDDGDLCQVLDAFVAKLPRHAQTQRRPVPGRQFAAVHPVRQQRLRMPGVRSVDALPVIVVRVEDDVSRIRAGADEVQDVRERHPNPFRDERPSFFTCLM